jgi:long-chain fatty acid transport protein
MKQIIMVTTALTTLTAGAAFASGLDRSNQSVLSVFDAPHTASASVSHIIPDVTGTDATGAAYDVATSYTQTSLTYANAINETLSYAVIFDQPFATDVLYNGNPSVNLLSGTKADISSQAITFVLKYQLDPRMSVFGGLRAQEAGGDVALNGTGYAAAFATSLVPLAGGAASFLTNGGYQAHIQQDWGLGYTFGAAYEIPDIALRLAVTYHSEVTHKTTARETTGLVNLGTNAVAFQTPQSVNVDFQTGLNTNTLLLAGLRWTDWADFSLTPAVLGQNLATISAGWRWNVGVARRFTDTIVGLASLTYEAETSDVTKSPLGPTDGIISLSLGGRYTNGGLNISGGINYSILGAVDPGIGGAAVATFRDNSAVGLGLKLDYKF